MYNRGICWLTTCDGGLTTDFQGRFRPLGLNSPVMSSGETPEHPLLSEEAGRVELLLGNEAIVRGAIEAGVGFACGYPGTP
ncbi:MAG: hypothetical protein CMJ87_06850 [Planctomycetes bacterium]|nr:hypothetical protein [Planctomycetota bacterium]